MSAKDYQISFPFGATSAPYSPASPHKGEDRIMPVGTSVVVNGVQIGLSGNTGYSSGAHLHIGKFTQNGTLMAPLGQGFYFNNARVITVGSDATNGNYVRLMADSYYYVYCHLSSQTCYVGQVLTPPQQQPAPKPVDGDIMNTALGTELYRTSLHREPESNEAAGHWNGQNAGNAIADVRTGDEWLTQNDVILRAYPALQAQAIIHDYDNEYGRWNKLFMQIRGRNASRDEFKASAVGQTWLHAMEILSDSTEADAATSAADSLKQSIADLQTQLVTVNKALSDLQVVDTNDKQALQEALSHVNVQSAKLAATVVMVAPVKVTTSTILPANKPSLIQVIKLLFSKN